jgi:hypothetical protein
MVAAYTAAVATGTASDPTRWRLFRDGRDRHGCLSKRVRLSELTGRRSRRNLYPRPALLLMSARALDTPVHGASAGFSSGKMFTLNRIE